LKYANIREKCFFSIKTTSIELNLPRGKHRSVRLPGSGSDAHNATNKL